MFNAKIKIKNIIITLFKMVPVFFCYFFLKTVRIWMMFTHLNASEKEIKNLLKSRHVFFSAKSISASHLECSCIE